MRVRQSRQVPVDLSEKRMTFDVVRTARTGAETLSSNRMKERSNEWSHFRFRRSFSASFSASFGEEERSVALKTGRVNVDQSVSGQKLEMNSFI